MWARTHEKGKRQEGETSGDGDSERCLLWTKTWSCADSLLKLQRMSQRAVPLQEPLLFGVQSGFILSASLRASKKRKKKGAGGRVGDMLHRMSSPCLGLDIFLSIKSPGGSAITYCCKTKWNNRRERNYRPNEAQWLCVYFREGGVGLGRGVIWSLVSARCFCSPCSDTDADVERAPDERTGSDGGIYLDYCTCHGSRGMIGWQQQLHHLLRPEPEVTQAWTGQTYCSVNTGKKYLYMQKWKTMRHPHLI